MGDEVKIIGEEAFDKVLDIFGPYVIEAPIGISIPETESLTGYHLSTLGNFIKRDANLSELGFHFFNTESGEIKSFIEGLKRNKTLKSLEIEFNKLTDEDGELFAQLLENGENKTLEHLVLKQSSTKSGSKNKVSPSILERINKRLEFNKIFALIRNKKKQELQKYVKDGVLQLQNMKLEYEDVRLLIGMLPEDTSIIGLNLDGNEKISKGQVKKLEAMLRAMLGLEELIYKNHTVMKDFDLLLERIKNDTLEPTDIDNRGMLQLAGKAITDDNVKALYDTLKAHPNPKIKGIDLRDNQITNEGARYLVNILKRTSITRLLYIRNKIEDEYIIIELNTLLRDRRRYLKQVPKGGRDLKKELMIRRNRKKKLTRPAGPLTLEDIAEKYKFLSNPPKKDTSNTTVVDGKTKSRLAAERAKEEIVEGLSRTVETHESQLKHLTQRVESLTERIVVLEAEKEARLMAEIEKLHIDLQGLKKDQKGQKQALQKEISEKEIALYEVLESRSQLLSAAIDKAEKNAIVHGDSALHKTTERLRAELHETLRKKIELFSTRVIDKQEWKEYTHKLEVSRKEQEKNQKEQGEKIKTVEVFVKETKEGVAYLQKFAADLKDDAAFLSRTRPYLKKAVNQIEEGEFKELMLKDPRCAAYFRTMVFNMTSLHSAAASVKSGYVDFKPEKGALKAISKILEFGGDFVPYGGGIVKILGKAVGAVNNHFTKKHLENFAKIAASPVEVTQIVEEVSFKLICEHKNNITHKLASDHLGVMIAAIFKGELKNLQTKDEIVDALFKIVMRDRSLKATPGIKGRFLPVPPSKEKIGSKLEEKHKNGSKFSGELRAMLVPGNTSTGVQGTGGSTLRLTSDQRSDIKDRLGDIYTDLFDDVKVKRKGEARNSIRTAILNKAKISREFRAAFLKNGEGDYNKVYKALKTFLSQRLESEKTMVVTQKLANEVVEKLAHHLTSQQNQRTASKMAV